MCGALGVGCAFPDYVADLDATTGDDSASGDSAIGVDTCTSPCGCGHTSDASVDGHDAAADAHPDVFADAIDFDASTDASSDAPTDTSDAIVAVDGSIGESCGPCGTGKKLCVGTTLACSVDDDRKTVVDSTYPMTNVTRTFDRQYVLAIGYPLHKPSSTPYSVQLTFGRQGYLCPSSTTPTNPDPACDRCTFNSVTGIYTCTVSKPIDGQLTVRVLRGQPTDAAPTELARVNVPATSIPIGGGLGAAATTIVFPIAPSAPPLPLGTSIYVELSTDSSAWSFDLAGDRPRTDPAPADVTMWTRSLYPPGTWTVETTGLLTKAILPAYAIDVRGCF
jgi:hypothetical protein